MIGQLETRVASLRANMQEETALVDVTHVLFQK